MAYVEACLKLLRDRPDIRANFAEVIGTVTKDTDWKDIVDFFKQFGGPYDHDEVWEKDNKEMIVNSSKYQWTQKQFTYEIRVIEKKEVDARGQPKVTKIYTAFQKGTNTEVTKQEIGAREDEMNKPVAEVLRARDHAFTEAAWGNRGFGPGGDLDHLTYMSNPRDAVFHTKDADGNWPETTPGLKLWDGVEGYDTQGYAHQFLFKDVSTIVIGPAKAFTEAGRAFRTRQFHVYPIVFKESENKLFQQHRFTHWKKALVSMKDSITQQFPFVTENLEKFLSSDGLFTQCFSSKKSSDKCLTYRTSLLTHIFTPLAVNKQLVFNIFKHASIAASNARNQKPSFTAELNYELGKIQVGHKLMTDLWPQMEGEYDIFPIQDDNALSNYEIFQPIEISVQIPGADMKVSGKMKVSSTEIALIMFKAALFNAAAFEKLQEMETAFQVEREQLLEPERWVRDDHSTAHLVKVKEFGQDRQKMKGFDGKTWDTFSFQAAKLMFTEKFKSKKYQKILLDTGNKVIVYNSANAAWGYRVPNQTDPILENPSTWTGQNMLGAALMAVRQQLLN